MKTWYWHKNEKEKEKKEEEVEDEEKCKYQGQKKKKKPPGKNHTYTKRVNKSMNHCFLTPGIDTNTNQYQKEKLFNK